MEKFTLRTIYKMFAEYGFWAQKAKDDPSTILAKKNIDIQRFLSAFYSFDVYTYALVDITDLKIVKVGGTISQMTGYEPSYFEGRSFYRFLKLHTLQDIYKSLKGSKKYFEYLYSQSHENRKSIKANRTLDLIKQDGSKIHVLVQGIPVLFNAKMEVIMFLLICTDISELKNDHKFTHFIIDSSNENQVKKILIDNSVDENDNVFSPSPSESKVLLHLSNGLSSKQIADQLYISQHTVRTHRKNMLKKFDCRSSSELVRKAVLEGWI
jgi:DNA-binding CsgD family transcriptional regulator